jgi:SH3-like domain-containing protein
MLTRRLRRAFTAAVTLLAASAAAAAAFARPSPSGLPTPRYVSLKAEPANARQGPSFQHPVLWQYHRAGLPLRVTAESENWRRTEDFEGGVAWVHVSMLSAAHTVLVMEPRMALRARPEAQAAARAWVERGVVLELLDCRGAWRKLRVRNRTGWTPASGLWGAGGCGRAAAG